MDGHLRVREAGLVWAPGARRTLPEMSGDADPGAREVLLAKRAEIVAKVDALGEHDPAEVANLGFGKRIGDATCYAVGRMTDAYQARTIYATVADIDQALERLEAGTYGLCARLRNGDPGGTARSRALGRALRALQREAGPIATGALTARSGSAVRRRPKARSRPAPPAGDRREAPTPSLLPRTSSCTRHSMIAARWSDWRIREVGDIVLGHAVDQGVEVGVLEDEGMRIRRC